MARDEISRLIQWLKDHGFSAEDIVDCIEYISTGRKSQK